MVTRGPAMPLPGRSPRAVEPSVPANPCARRSQQPHSQQPEGGYAKWKPEQRTVTRPKGTRGEERPRAPPTGSTRSGASRGSGSAAGRWAWVWGRVQAKAARPRARVRCYQVAPPARSASCYADSTTTGRPESRAPRARSSSTRCGLAGDAGVAERRPVAVLCSKCSHTGVAPRDLPRSPAWRPRHAAMPLPAATCSFVTERLLALVLSPAWATARSCWEPRGAGCCGARISVL